MKRPLKTTKARSRRPKFAVCVSNEGYTASLEVRKIYALLPDPNGDAIDSVRIVDESGDDFVYPRKLFAELTPSRGLSKTLSALTESGSPPPSKRSRDKSKAFTAIAAGLNDAVAYAKGDTSKGKAHRVRLRKR